MGSLIVQRVQIAFDKFKIIFQVTKEIPNLPEGSDRSEDAHLRDELLRCVRLARQIARAVKPDPISVDVLEAESSAVSLLEGSSPGADGTGIVKLELPGEVIGIWRPFAERVLAEMNGRELFLRTGYEVAEMRKAIELLPRLQP
ncbi:hypothetical protein [Streptomyces violaceusniger]|uniref:Uncharacterized protein n=1 Tax=Streptomyces violaceusniger (strain Tu 4113) TaxID=653045 RepID=G2NWU0_STRV4|nr:hypothetical protein [Streptomyces violaceusniger]AEM87124.1 hypothetical protein Strvi_7790 [Streptomyces violaceusniger Tu 4113]